MSVRVKDLHSMTYGSVSSPPALELRAVMSEANILNPLG